MADRSKTIVSLTAEQTARWFAGEDEPWSQGLVDPEMRERFDRQKQALVEAFNAAAPAIVEALGQDSHETAMRLKHYWLLAAAGDPNGRRLLITMLSELVSFAYNPKA